MRKLGILIACLVSVGFIGCASFNPSNLPEVSSLGAATRGGLSLFSESINFTNDVLINIDGRHDNPISIKAVYVTFDTAQVNGFKLIRLRPMGNRTNEDIILNFLGVPVSYLTDSFYFDSGLNMKIFDQLYVTNTFGNGECVFTYDYKKGKR